MSTIAESFQILYDIKENIKNSIEGKGVSVGDAPFTEYSNKIDEIVVDPMDGNYDEGYAKGFSEGYSSGKTDGNSEGYTNGYNAGTVDGYADGKADGENEVKANMQTITITANGAYSDEEVTVAVDVETPYNNGYTSGYTDGENNIINKATTLNVTENGTYNSDSNIFYNSVVVEVPLYKIVTLTQDEYNAIENKDNETIYLIKN